MAGRYILIRIGQGGFAPTTASCSISIGEPHRGRSGPRDVPLRTLTRTLKTPGGKLTPEVLADLAAAIQTVLNGAWDQPTLPF